MDFATFTTVVGAAKSVKDLITSLLETKDETKQIKIGNELQEEIGKLQGDLFAIGEDRLSQQAKIQELTETVNELKNKLSILLEVDWEPPFYIQDSRREKRRPLLPEMQGC